MKQPEQCCVCHGGFGEHSVATRWPGGPSYCEMDWEKVGKFRAVEDMREGMLGRAS